MSSRRDFRDLDGADPWKLLGVTRDAGPEEIKRSYRRLSRSHHTDVGGDATQQAKLNRAYEILSDPGRRADYALLLNPKKPTAPSEAPRAAEPEEDPFEWSSGPGTTYTPPRQPRQDPYTAPPYREPTAPPYREPTAPPYNDPFTATSYRPRRPGVSRQAVAALLTVPFCSPVSIYLSITALRQIRWSGQRGKSIAWLALLLNIGLFVWVIIGGVIAKL
jgi:curved DNA-binding protein CbpA